MAACRVAAKGKSLADITFDQVVTRKMFLLFLGFMIIECSVPDPDPGPPDPHVFGPPDAVWIRIRIVLSSSKNSQKTLIPTFL
jgi:hypothetical protein